MCTKFSENSTPQESKGLSPQSVPSSQAGRRICHPVCSQGNLQSSWLLKLPEEPWLPGLPFRVSLSFLYPGIRPRPLSHTSFLFFCRLSPLTASLASVVPSVYPALSSLCTCGEFEEGCERKELLKQRHRELRPLGFPDSFHIVWASRHNTDSWAH